jgi:hypothetical protein
MEPAGSLSHSQVPAACPYPEPDKSSPCPHIPPLKLEGHTKSNKINKEGMKSKNSEMFKQPTTSLSRNKN